MPRQIGIYFILMCRPPYVWYQYFCNNNLRKGHLNVFHTTFIAHHTSPVLSNEALKTFNIIPMEFLYFKINSTVSARKTLQTWSKRKDNAYTNKFINDFMKKCELTVKVCRRKPPILIIHVYVYAMSLIIV